MTTSPSARFAALCVLCAGLYTQRVHALDLFWDAPEGCPSRDEILARIAARTPQAGAGWEARAHVTRSGAQYTLELGLLGPNAETARREVTAATCAALADAVAVLVTLALEPTASEAPEVPAAVSGGEVSVPQASPSSAPAPEPQPRATAVPQAAIAAPSLPSSRSQGLQLGFDVAAALSVGVGMLPGGPSLGLRPQIALRLGPVRTAIGGVFWFSRESQPAAYPRASMQDHALIADLALGLDLSYARVLLQPNLALELGQLSLKTSGISAPTEARTRWAALGAGLQVAYRIVAGYGLFAEAVGLVPLSPPRFVVQTRSGNITLFEPAGVALRLSAGMAYVFE